ncbi:hypothetical protein Cgig2_025554 [Carnegiea gigantea]|uniref:Uncharacterized protein n=1 Tax=Carnegiea gigantea TaxID=171969 RepID=A0A9Q1GI35_9CARY|nr:hypothetical protein Cgig2_025554 [Carnegiea gigantea]
MLHESLAEKWEASGKDERSEKTSKKPQEEGEDFEKSPTKLKKKERAEKVVKRKKKELKKKVVVVMRSQRMSTSSKPPVKKGHIFELKISKSLDAEQNNLSYEGEEVDHDDNRKEGEEERMIPEIVKDVPKRNKPSLKSQVGEKTTSSAQDVQMAPLEQALKCDDEGANEKMTYQKAFITRITTRSF